MKTQKSFLLFAGIILITVNSFSQWPQWRGPGRDGICTESGLLSKWPTDGPALAWSVTIVGEGFSSTVIQDQMVFTQGKVDSLEMLTALDLKGNVLWQKPIGRALTKGEWQHSRSTPTFFRGKIYALTAMGDIACFDARSSKTEWQMRAFEKFGGTFQQTAESPLVTDDKVIITPCGFQTTIVALDRFTGKTLWRSECLRDSNYFGSPFLIKGKNKNYIFQSSMMYDFITDPATGKIIWKDKRASGNMVPQLINNQIYSPGADKGGSLCKWNEELSQRTIVWSDTVKALVISGAAIINDKVVVSCLPRGICSIDMKTGKPLARLTRLRTCNFLVAGNQLYCYEDGTARVYLFNITDKGFEMVSSFKTASGTGPSIAHMSIANGLLFIRHGTSLMAYNIKAS
jgi:outer membrane protein assembly factor BamB